MHFAEIGDIYAVPLPNNWYGAVRVINRMDGSTLLATTTYLDLNIPNLDDKCLQTILKQNRFFYEHELALYWVDGCVPPDIIYIGNIPLSKTEKKLTCSSYSGMWEKHSGQEAWYEWRWIHDRANFEIEIQEEEKKMQSKWKKRPQSPKTMMEDHLFWEIISLLDWKVFDQDQYNVLEPAIYALSRMKVKDIKQFQETLTYKLYLLDTREHAKNIGATSYEEANDEYVSADVFLYTRCLAIACGKNLFEKALAEPIHMPKNKDFEPLLYLAEKAYTRRMGKKFEYETGCDYESFSNKEGWK